MLEREGRRMKRAVGIVAGMMLLAALLGAGSGSGRNFSADLTGDQEVPQVSTETVGKAKFHADVDETELRFSVKVKNAEGLLGVAGAHIHCAPAGSNGPVVAFLAGSVPGGLGGTVDFGGTLTDDNVINPACGATIAELLDSMQDGDTYVNGHSLANPGGEVRGQIG